MAKLKDGFYKQTASSIGSDLLVLLAGGGAKPISDFAEASALDNYLPLSGGILTSSGNPLTIKRTDNSGPGLVFYSKDTQLGSIGISTDYVPKFYNANVGILYTMWHNGNDGSGSGLDADLLDGKHDGEVTAQYFSPGKLLTSSDTINKLMSGIYCYINGNNPTGSIDDNVVLLSFRNTGRTDMIQFVGAANTSNLYYRRAANIGNQYENWTSWKTIAFTDSNVASATKLQTARTIWGQSFDGTGNVSGTVKTMSGHGLHLAVSDDTYWQSKGIISTSWESGIEDYTDILVPSSGTNNARIRLLKNGNVGIGTTDPAYKLDVVGSIQSSDTVYGKAVTVVGNTVGPYLPNINWLDLTKDVGFHVSYRLNETAKPLRFYYKNSDTFTLLVDITSSGSVGIGTTSPIHKLQVAGAGVFNNTGSTTYATNGITIGAGDAAERYITCYGKTGSSYINVGYGPGTNNSGEFFFNYVSSGSTSNYSGVGIYGGANYMYLYPDYTTFRKPLVMPGELYSGNCAINMSNSDIININALYTADNAERGTEGLQFSRGNGYYDSIWASSGTLYFSPNGNLNRAGSYSTNYTVIHSGNIGSQSVNYATSAGNADTVDSCHKDDFLRRTATLGSINKFVLEDIPKGVTQVGSIGWTDYQNYPHAGGLWMTLRGTSSLSTALILFPSYSMSSPPILYSSIDGGAWQGGYQLAYTSQIPTTMAWGNITGKPSTFTPSSHTHDDRYYTESEADSRFINHSGDTMTGPLTFANGTWNVVGDDAAIGDYNAAGMLGLKSINNNIPGIGFHNSSNTLLGRLQANGSNLLWNDNKIWHAGNDGSGSGLDADLLDGYHVTHFMSYIKGSGYVQANLLNSELWNVAGGNGYIEYYDNGTWFNSRWGLVLAISGFHRVGSSDSYVLLGGGGHKAVSDFAPASHNHNGSYVYTGGMVNGACAVIPTYNGETGWHRIATIDGGTGYGSWILYLCGDWSWASNTSAILHINTMHTTAKITQVSGIVGFVTDVRLVPISANNYYVDVYVNYSGANTPGTVYCYFLGNGAITTRTTAEKITASVSTAASITLVTGTKTNDNSYAAHFYENSDVMLKTNIKSITDSDNMPLLKEFDWKSDGSHGYGLIAQELEAMGYPELVNGELDGTKTVNYSAALSLIVGKLQVKIKELEKEIEILKKKN